MDPKDMIEAVLEGKSPKEVLELDVGRELKNWEAMVKKYKGSSKGRSASFKSSNDMEKFVDAVESKYPKWMQKMDFPTQKSVVLKVK